MTESPMQTLLREAERRLGYVAAHMAEDYSGMATRACKGDKYAFEVGVELGIARGIVTAVGALLKPEDEFEDD